VRGFFVSVCLLAGVSTSSAGTLNERGMKTIHQLSSDGYEVKSAFISPVTYNGSPQLIETVYLQKRTSIFRCSFNQMELQTAAANTDKEILILCAELTK
jgi:hypothetical protein